MTQHMLVLCRSFIAAGGRIVPCALSQFGGADWPQHGIVALWHTELVGGRRFRARDRGGTVQGCETDRLGRVRRREIQLPIKTRHHQDEEKRSQREQGVLETGAGVFRGHVCR